MDDDSPKLLNGGPVFESAPGWGFYVKRWLKKYLLKIILPVIIVVVIVGVLAASRSSENGKNIVTPDETVKITVLRGDGHVLVARRALADYLKTSPQALTGGQKVFIEETLRKGMGNKKLIVGEEIRLDFNDFTEAISQSKNLSPYQLQVWEGYAQKAKLE